MRTGWRRVMAARKRLHATGQPHIHLCAEGGYLWLEAEEVVVAELREQLRPRFSRRETGQGRALAANLGFAVLREVEELGQLYLIEVSGLAEARGSLEEGLPLLEEKRKEAIRRRQANGGWPPGH